MLGSPGPGSVGSSEITLAVLVNRILERMLDYNPKGDSLSYTTPRRSA